MWWWSGRELFEFDLIGGTGLDGMDVRKIGRVKGRVVHKYDQFSA